MPTLTYYANMKRAQNLIEGKPTFFKEVFDLIKAQGWDVSFKEIDPSVKLSAGIMEDYALVDKMLVPFPNVLSFRECAFRNYWTIEKAEFRNNFRLHDAVFDPSDLRIEESAEFTKNLMKRQKVQTAVLPNDVPINEEGAVLIALQGRLLDHRVEQVCCPIDMIKSVRAHQPHKRIVAKLHPFGGNENREIEALKEVCLDLDVELSEGDLEDEFKNTHYVVTMNSTVAQKAMLWGIPSLVFAHADFHHICISMHREANYADAFAKIQSHKPDYQSYLQWYLEGNMINRHAAGSPVRALNMMVDLGFPLEKLPQ